MPPPGNRTPGPATRCAPDNNICNSMTCAAGARLDFNPDPRMPVDSVNQVAMSIVDTGLAASRWFTARRLAEDREGLTMADKSSHKTHLKTRV